MSNYGLLINGELVKSDMTLDVINPATEEVFTQVPRADEAMQGHPAHRQGASRQWTQSSSRHRRGR